MTGIICWRVEVWNAVDEEWTLVGQRHTQRGAERLLEQRIGSFHGFFLRLGVTTAIDGRALETTGALGTKGRLLRAWN